MLKELEVRGPAGGDGSPGDRGPAAAGGAADLTDDAAAIGDGAVVADLEWVVAEVCHLLARAEGQPLLSAGERRSVAELLRSLGLLRAGMGFLFETDEGAAVRAIVGPQCEAK